MPFARFLVWIESVCLSKIKMSMTSPWDRLLRLSLASVERMFVDVKFSRGMADKHEAPSKPL